MAQHSNDYWIFRETLDDFAVKIASFGLAIKSQNEEKLALLGGRTIYKANYESALSKVEVEIVFMPAVSQHHGVTIVRVISPKGLRLNVEDWLEARDTLGRLRLFTYESTQHDLRLHLQKFFDMLWDLFNNELKDCIEGKIELATPIDWQGLK